MHTNAYRGEGGLNMTKNTHLVRKFIENATRGLPLITYAPRGDGGVNTNAYKCVQGGRGGLNMTKNTHFVRKFIENATISSLQR